MAIKIDENLLSELGLGDLAAEDKQALLKQIRETLEMRVGMKIAEALSEAQLKEFEKFMETGDEAGAMAWLGKNYPNYKEVVAQQLEKLKAEIAHDAPTIKKELGDRK